MIELHMHNVTIPYAKNLHQNECLKMDILEHKLQYFENLQWTPMFNSDYITTQITQLKTVL